MSGVIVCASVLYKDNIMNIYTPEYWELIECITPDSYTIKVFGAWRGGFAGADSWKLSSGIVGLEPIDGDHLRRLEENFYAVGIYTFPQYSGSVYSCFAKRRGLNHYGYSVLQGLLEQQMPEGCSFKVLELEL
jgi:hypothetical protein